MNFDYAIQVADNFIADEESFSAYPYYDVNGYAIGYGNHYYEDGSSVTSDDDPITQARALQLLDFVVRQKANIILPHITAPINENQFAALVSLTYNCGEGNVESSTLLSMINSGASADAINAQFQKTCVTAKGNYMDSLYNRRVNESALFMTVVQQFVKKNIWEVVVVAAIAAGLTVYYIHLAIKKGK